MLSLLIQHQEISFAKELLKKAKMMLTLLSCVSGKVIANRAGLFIWKNFSRANYRDLGTNRANMNTSKFLQWK